MRALQNSPRTLHPIGTLFLLVFLLTGAKAPTAGDILLQEGLIYRTEGLKLQKMGELQRAAAAFQKAVAIKPDYAEAYNDLGVVLEGLGDAARAEEAYKTALNLKPDLGSAHSNLALLYEESDRVKEAAVHWGARARLGPPGDPWVVAAREKLTKYQLPVPETPADLAGKKDKEIRLAIGTGKAHMDAGRWDKATESFEQALRIDPRNAEALRLLHLTKTRAAQAEGRQARELEAAKGRVKKESDDLRRREQARKAELERERIQAQQLKAAQTRVIKETVSKKQTARQLKELEEARRKADEAELRAQKAEQQRQLEAAKRIEAENRAEKIEAKAAADRKLEESEKARGQVEEAKRRAADAERRAEIARKAAEAARLAAEAAGQTYEAAQQTVEAARETEALVKQTEAPAAPAPKKVVKPAVEVKKVKPAPEVKVKPAPSAVSPDAQALAREIAKEKSKVRGRASDDLTRRAAVAMREGFYQDAIEIYKQILILEPGNRSAKQGLERAQKALAKAAQ